MSEDITNNEQSPIIVAHEFRPDIVPIIPISQRPIFPGMMIPLILTGDVMIETARRLWIPLIRLEELSL